MLRPRRLLSRLKSVSIEDLMRLIEADHSGRQPLPGGLPGSARSLLDLCRQEQGRVEPLLKGRHLIEMGLTPGPQFGRLLKTAYEAQLDGEFTTLQDGLEWLRENEL